MILIFLKNFMEKSFKYQPPFGKYGCIISTFSERIGVDINSLPSKNYLFITSSLYVF